jgi:hypothetical protein
MRASSAVPGQFDGGLAGCSAGFAGLLKSTTGGFAMADSFSTVKFGFTS